MNRPGQLFGDIADTYHQSRPPVPVDGVEWLTEGKHNDVLELGAGTGQFTTQLLGLKSFSRVHAVEPDRRMLRQLRINCPDAVSSPGLAELIPLPDASIDAVFAAGAWHWFDTAAACAEIARVLRAQGTLGVVWNMRDRSHSWIRELDTIVGHHHVPEHEPRKLNLDHALFAAAEEFTIEWEWPVTRAEFVLSLGSYSYVLNLPLHERAAVLSAAQRFLTEDADVVRDNVIRVPIRTKCYRTRLLTLRSAADTEAAAEVDAMRGTDGDR